MKKSLKKAIFVLALLACVLIIVCTATIFADTKRYTVKYYSKGILFDTATTSASGSVVLRKDPKTVYTGRTMFGWYTLDPILDDRSFFAAGSVLTPDCDVELYEAYGVEVSTEEEFLEAVKKTDMFIRLKNGITVHEQIVLPESGTTVIDLNGKTLEVSSKLSGTDYSTSIFKGTNGSLSILDTTKLRQGKIDISGAIDDKYPTTAVFEFTPNEEMNKDIELRIFTSVEITSNLGFVNVNSDISEKEGTLKVIINGEITSSNYMLRSHGMKNAEIYMNDGSKFVTNGFMLFEDIGENDGEVASLYIKGGKFGLNPAKTVISNEPERFGIYITGGLFENDIASLFPDGHYVFKVQRNEYDNQVEGFVLDYCKHEMRATNVTATCTEPGEATYKCLLCRDERTEAVSALGHSTYKILLNEIEITPEKTVPGRYGIFCQKCDYEEIEYFYPSPQNVYVQVMIRDEDGNVNSYPVKATELYGSDLGERLQTFNTMLIEEHFKCSISDIVGIEIPLGVKVIAGGIGKTDGKEVPKGLFYGNDHLEKIILPETLETVEEYAFANMAKLKEIEGIEHISGTIKQFAFQQIDNPDTKDVVEIPQLVFDKDHDGDGATLTVNARTIEENAFYNSKIKTLRLGENVDVIKDRAFGIDTSLFEPIMIELFIDEVTASSANGKALPRTIENVKNDFTGAFTSIGKNHVFSEEYLVFENHDYTNDEHEATCQEKGYTKQFCTRCEVTTFANETDPIPHDFTVKTKVRGTCSMQGYTIYKCSMCEEVDESTKTHEIDDYYDYDNHTFDKQVYYDGYEIITDICSQSYYIVDQCTGALCGNFTGEPPAISLEKTYMAESMGGYGGLHEPLGNHVPDYMNPVKKTPATCGSKGEQTLLCIHCSTEIVEEIKPTGRHSLAPDSSQSIAGTCQKEGLSVVVCTVCDYKKETVLVKNKDNHVFGEWVTVVEPTVETAGLQRRECPCGEIETAGIPVRTDIAEKQSKVWLIVGIIGGVLLVGGAIFLTLYFTVLRKSPSKSYKYKFNTLGKR